MTRLGRPVAQAPSYRATPCWGRWSAPPDVRPSPAGRGLVACGARRVARWRRASRSRPGPGPEVLAAGGIAREHLAWRCPDRLRPGRRGDTRVQGRRSRPPEADPGSRVGGPGRRRHRPWPGGSDGTSFGPPTVAVAPPSVLQLGVDLVVNVGLHAVSWFGRRARRRSRRRQAPSQGGACGRLEDV